MQLIISDIRFQSPCLFPFENIWRLSLFISIYYQSIKNYINLKVQVSTPYEQNFKYLEILYKPKDWKLTLRKISCFTAYPPATISYKFVAGLYTTQNSSTKMPYHFDLFVPLNQEIRNISLFRLCAYPIMGFLNNTWQS